MGSSADSEEGRLRRQAIAHLERLRGEGMWGLHLSAPKVEGGHERPPVAASGSGQEPQAPAAEPAAAKAPARPSPLFDDGQGGLFGNGGDDGPSADETLEEIEAEALECVACKLHEGRNKVVFGTGDPNARLMFIGEGPGRDEDIQGEPFVGRAGRLLTRIIEAMGYERGDVYIANVVKCRPPQNRNPQADEMSACEHFLLRQIAVIRPRIIVLLGRVAVQAILQSSAPMSRLRGQFQRWRGIPMMCTYHPAYLLRNPNAKKDVWEDMQMVRDALAEGRE